MDEFSFIQQFFSNLNPSFASEAERMGLTLGIGDDAAVVHLDGSYSITTDTLIEEVHFFSAIDPYLLGHRALTVNFSDLYAMGARPQFVTLSLSLPSHYTQNFAYWQQFSRGFAQALSEHHCALIGGNISAYKHKSPLNITVTAIGKSVQGHHILRRDQAKVGDLIYVTGYVGTNALYVDSVYSDAIKGLASAPSADGQAGAKELWSLGDFEKQAYSYSPHYYDLVAKLAQFSHCAIDVSDGLIGDLSHILVHSHCRARLDVKALPLDPQALKLLPSLQREYKYLRNLGLSGGGDYNLIFLVSKENAAKLMEQVKADPKLNPELEGNIKLSLIGEIIESQATDDFKHNLATNNGLISFTGLEDGESESELKLPTYDHFLSPQH